MKTAGSPLRALGRSFEELAKEASLSVMSRPLHEKAIFCYVSSGQDAVMQSISCLCGNPKRELSIFLTATISFKAPSMIDKPDSLVEKIVEEWYDKNRDLIAAAILSGELG